MFNSSDTAKSANEKVAFLLPQLQAVLKVSTPIGYNFVETWFVYKGCEK